MHIDNMTRARIAIPVAFEPDATVGMLAPGRMQHELSALLARPVDLVPRVGLKPRIRESVLAASEVLYAR